MHKFSFICCNLLCARVKFIHSLTALVKINEEINKLPFVVFVCCVFASVAELQITQPAKGWKERMPAGALGILGIRDLRDFWKDYAR